MNDYLNLENIKKIARILGRIMNIVFWFSVIGGIMQGIFLFTTAQAWLENPTLSFNIGHIIRYKIEINDNSNDLINIYRYIFSLSIIYYFIALFFIRNIYNILKTVEEGKPFVTKNVKNLSVMGVIIIIYSFVSPVMYIFIGKKIKTITEIANIDIAYRINMMMLVVGILLIILSGVFKYGTYLQQEYNDIV